MESISDNSLQTERPAAAEGEHIAKSSAIDQSAGNVIVFSHLSFTYPGQTDPALRDVTFPVGQGEFVAVLGANGSGKSTLLKAVDGLLHGEFEGTISALGFDPNDSSEVLDIRRRCGVVFQDPDSQSIASLVEEEVAFGARNIGVSGADLDRRVDEALHAVGLPELRGRLIHELSGGQKQRIALAGALAMKPEILLLDEPSSMLDPSNRKQLMEIIGQLHAQGMTVLLVTHHIEEAEHADRILVLDRGKLVLDGAPMTIFENGAILHELGLELPFELELKRLVEERGKRAMAEDAADGANLRTDGDCVPVTEPIVELVEASFSYELGSQKKSKRRKGDVLCEPTAWELDKISLCTKPGQVLGIIGPMGSGKTTLLQVMAGLLVPQKGSAAILGTRTDVRPKERKALRGKIGLAFQHPEQQLFASTVLEDAAFGPRNLGFSKAKAESLALDALALMGLEPEAIADESPFLLSGGMQRRVALAGILAMQPACLALDEPVAGLDPHARKALFRTLHELARTGTGIVLTTHSMEDAARECDELVVMGEGKILLHGTPAEVISRENTALLDSLGLDLPWPARYALDHGIASDTTLPLDMQTLADMLAA